MPKLSVVNKQGKETSKLDLPEKIFTGRIKKDVIHQVVVMYANCLRQGHAATKERADVNGGGTKPFRQKGTGRARAGSTRSPLWKGGGVTFGPHPRDYRYSLPKKIRQAALKEILNAKFQSKNLLCIEELKDQFSKTKEFAKILAALKLEGKILAVLDGCDESIRRVSRNIPRFRIVRAEDVNVYDIAQNRKLLLTKTAVEKILKRLQDL